MESKVDLKEIRLFAEKVAAIKEDIVALEKDIQSYIDLMEPPPPPTPEIVAPADGKWTDFNDMIKDMRNHVAKTGPSIINISDRFYSTFKAQCSITGKTWEISIFKVKFGDMIISSSFEIQKLMDFINGR